jgi:hypothetical protein
MNRREILTDSGKSQEADLLATLEKISCAAQKHDEGKGIPVDAFFHAFKKKYGLRRDAVQG